MTQLVFTSFADLSNGATCARIRLSAPRANALEPKLLRALNAALDAVEKGRADVVLLSSAGRNFCSGGDVACFAQAVADGRGVDYANDVVGQLQAVVLRLLSMSQVIGIAGRGAITGGGAGFLFASDVAVLSPDAFVQPFYTRVGFAPDGGWTALLPDSIGAARALSWQLENRSVAAEEAVQLGLAAKTHPDPEGGMLELFSQMNVGSARETKGLIWDSKRLRQVEARLKSEANAFRKRINKPDTIEGMAHFLSSARQSKHA